MNWLKKLLGKGKKADTEAELAHLLTEQTGDPAFMQRSNWITAYGRMDFTTALAEVNEALQITPNDPLYLALRAMTHYSMKNYTGAESDVGLALKGDPAQREALGVRDAMRVEAKDCRATARELGKKGRDQEAVALLTKATELEPGNAENFFFRGIMYHSAGDFNAAVSDVTHALELDPRYPDAQETLQALKRVASRAKGLADPEGIAQAVRDIVDGTRTSSREAAAEVKTGVDQHVRRLSEALKRVQDAGEKGWNYEVYAECMVTLGGQATITRDEWAHLLPPHTMRVRDMFIEKAKEATGAFEGLRRDLEGV
jgi:tetratricopeptide (TPR) repeat protein